MCMITYYHYTDKAGLAGILRSRKIRKSSSGRYGEGVYFTRLSPRHGRAKISENNWDGAASYTEGQGKVDYAISALLPDHKMEQHGEIYVFCEDVDLDQTTYKLFSKHGDHRDLEEGHSGDESSGDESSRDEPSRDNDNSCTIL